MNLIFDYVYYRVCKFFFKWDGIDGNRGLWALAMIQGLLIMDIIILFFSLFYGRKALFSYSKVIGISGVCLTIGLMILNARKYDGRYEEFNTRWRNEPLTKRVFKGFLVLLSTLLPWLGLFLISKLP